MKKAMMFFGVAGCAVASLAGAFIVPDSVKFVQSDGGDGLATISYELAGGAAIITAEIQTNLTGAATNNDADWLPIGAEFRRSFAGDVNRLVEGDGVHTITWDPISELPGVKLLHGSCRAVVRAWAEDAPPDYMVVDIRRDSARTDVAATEPRCRYYTSTNELPAANGLADDIYRNGFMVMRRIPQQGAQYFMGSPADESNRSNNEDLHLVRLTEPDIYMAVFPLTIGQALNVTHWFKGDNYGITDLRIDGTSNYNYVLYQYHTLMAGEVNTNLIHAICNYARAVGSTDDDGLAWPESGRTVNSISICGKLRAQTGVDFDIPTEAQWEFACRAGTTTRLYANDLTIDKLAWLDGSAAKQAHHVGLLVPNAWGLYDMYGTAAEIVRDRYQVNLGFAPVWNPVGSTDGSLGGVWRGSSYQWNYTAARSAARVDNGSIGNQSGVRLICPVGLKWNRIDAKPRVVDYTYDLDADAIVTIDVQTNLTGAATANDTDWISIGEENFCELLGDVNTLVTAGTGKRIFWTAAKEWADQLVAGGALRIVLNKWAKATPPNYMVVDLDTDADRTYTKYPRVRYFTSTNALPEGGLANDIYRTKYMVMRRIPAQGVKWCMGNTTGRDGVGGQETPHYVTFLNKDYYMGIYTLTDGQFFRFLAPQYGLMHYKVTPNGAQINYSKSSGWNITLPAPQNYDIRGANYVWPTNKHNVDPAGLLGLMRTRTGVQFDLPTEAQWEFACRAGTGTAYSNGENSYNATLVNYAWCDDLLHPVGLKLPNPWGLYDMHGNVFEYCLDWYSDDLGADSVSDPVGPLTGTDRIFRGGSSTYAYLYTASAARTTPINSKYCSGMYGVRLVCPVDGDWDDFTLPEEE